MSNVQCLYVALMFVATKKTIQIYSDQGRGEESQKNTGRKSYWKGYGIKGTINEGEQSTYMYTCSVATQQL